MKTGGILGRLLVATTAALLIVLAAPAAVAADEPDPTVCNDYDCLTLPYTICDPGGFQVSLTGYIAADDPTNLTGNAFYTYEICNPPAGTCSLDPSRSCLDNDKCAQFGAGVCNRECAVDSFRGLSHFNVDFPDLGGESCLSADNFVGGSCSCTPGSSSGCSVQSGIVLGDGSCYSGTSTVAKCDGTELPEGDCIEMELQIAGETNALGLGTAVVVSKESQDCNESCIAGPSCERCDEPGGGDDACLTRTLGFWGTHPWITNNYAPVTVCGETVGCFGPDDGMSDPSCPNHACDSIMEALGSNGGELRHGAAYISMVRQLTAAKLNLSASSDLLGTNCSDFEYDGKGIDAWIAFCEGLCNKSQSQISGSGCIEALDAFNNSEDVLEVTPSPFDRPPVDDAGNVSGADPSSFTGASKGGYVIGRNVPGGANCKNP